MHGVTTDVAPWYRGADVLCLPSQYEAMPLVVLEAAAAGLPVVATHVGDVPALAEAGGALLIDRSVDALERSLAEMSEPAVRDRFGSAGHDWAATRSWPAVADVLRSSLDPDRFA